MESIKELIVRCKYDTLMQLIEKEGGWALFEDEKTYPDGVVVIARYVIMSSASPEAGTIHQKICGSFIWEVCEIIFSDLQVSIFSG